jgi:hypothetical protein
VEVCYDDDDDYDGYDDNSDDERYPFSLCLDVLTLGKYGMSGV